jgi:hypothetical protein
MSRKLYFICRHPAFAHRLAAAQAQAESSDQEARPAARTESAG